MKVFAAASALVLATAASTASAIDCFKNAAAITEALLPIIQPAYACQTATGFVIVPPSTLPTPEQVTAVCAKCPDLVLKGKDVKFPDCTVPIKGEDVPIEKLFGTILGQCSGAGVNLAANATSSANTTAPTAAPTPVKETGSTSGSSAAAGKLDATVETPAPTSTKEAASATTTAPPNSAAAGVSATLGAAVAVAFSVAALVL